MTAISGVLALLVVGARCQAQPTLGIPEPGLQIFGSITNSAGGLPLLINTVTWQVSGSSPADSATIHATVVSVNGQFFYIARVQFETRTVGVVNFGPTSNVLELTLGPTTYTRVVQVNGTNATIVFSSRGMLTNLTFGAADRGISERVDLQFNIPVDPSQDSDGDGMPDWAEILAGTDPKDANSAFKLATDVQPTPRGGLTIKWSSVAGKAYSIYRASDLSKGFTSLATNITASSPLNQYNDMTATGSGPYFYRIRVDQ